jgi:16S rRNA processing protein RimM
MDEGLVAIAKIIKPRGLRGEVVAEILTDFPERFEETEDVIVLTADGGEESLKIKESWFQKDRIVLKLEGVDSVEKAEKYRGSEICVAESDAVALDEGEFFDWQLQGCEVETVEGDRIGSVKELMRTGGTDILVVEGNGKDFLIPFAETICIDVDVDAKRIKIDPPEGLLDF